MFNFLKKLRVKDQVFVSWGRDIHSVPELGFQLLNLLDR